ncbi:ABC transporter substrate-binding protein [Paraglaciecola sp. MB-3u-78]|uniref:substrate-binding periplasmic protein n=1 Tax=Paraglaciecola sp. MB-3u-78 TaxID=2058332 RepID=UPI000C33C656|nr:transporter substrate-binding domain-containing protein [Paraglaciecola sp. MB-3u-78]PKG98345.1 amino acid ABC transporter substrate-binding protein [Paraglaciecola sp. MB-3u-78]
MKINYLFLLLLLSFIVSACNPQPPIEQTKSTPVAVAETIIPTEEQIPDKTCQFVLGFDAWEPYQYVDVGERVAGLDIELVAAVVKGMGCQLTYQQGTWVELLMALKQGDVDILLGASKTEAREEFALFSDAYRMEEFSLYIRKGDKVRAGYKTLSEFIQKGSRIGIVEDYFYGPDVSMLLDSAETSKYFVSAIMGELNVARLLDEDIDGYFEDSFVGAALLRRKALSNYIVAHGITIQTGNAYVMFSQKSVTQEQLSDFNTQLAEVKNSEIYQNILDKYSY